MTEPQQQPANPSDDSSGESRHVAAQPQYGQRIEPEYGARRMSFRRITTLTYMEASPSSRLRRRSRRRLSRPPCSELGRLPLRRFRSQCGSGSGWVRSGRSPTGAPRYFNGIDLNDPQQNPIYGHWDFYAIFSFIFALVSSFPVLPALIGCLAIWRTRRFHTRGRGLAIAAVVINVLTTIIVIWMTMHGISMDDMYQAMLNMLAPGMGGSGSGDSVSV